MAFTIKQNDTRPAYVATLLEDVGLPGEGPTDLTTATAATFIMRLTSANDPTVPKVHGDMDIIDAANGEVSYTWVAGDTDVVGDYNVEIEVEWNDGGIETFPNIGYGTLSITDDLG